jgi:HSP20 family protein
MKTTALVSLPNMVNSIDEVFNSFFVPNNYNRKETGNFYAKANIAAHNNGYHIALEVPGFSKENISVNFDKDHLIINGTKENTTEEQNIKFVRKEFNKNSFERRFYIDHTIDTQHISAKYENGILNVWIPKKEEAVITPAQIAVQ